MLQHIRQLWPTLTYARRDLAKSAADPKFHPDPDGRWPVYISKQEDLARVQWDLRRAMGSEFEKIKLCVLPDDPVRSDAHGLLYLPRPYVVPGGRFNEMYGWDSFFIAMGLLHDGQLQLAKDMADDVLYEVRLYGKVLNANRTYYLTRSQPPFLTRMILEVYQRSHSHHWLAQTMPVIERYYRYWTTEPHLTPETGLARYYDLGEGPAPEVLSSEGDKAGHNDYELIARYFRTHEIPDYDANLYYDRAHDRLTEAFYKGDRSMRESGFDPSNRFGPFGADIIHFNPVCLNSLLCIMENDTGEILETLGRGNEAEEWRDRARRRAAQVNRLMWDDQAGLYFDYNFERKSVRQYPYLATFYPLWAGIASPGQADCIVRNLPLFECLGGLRTSTVHTGDQWDSPFGWAPLEWIAVQGLRRYGYQKEADRISRRWLAMVTREYQRHGTLDEKYDVVHGRADVQKEILFGYRTNEAGFGWTNAVFESLHDELERR